MYMTSCELNNLKMVEFQVSIVPESYQYDYNYDRDLGTNFLTLDIINYLNKMIDSGFLMKEIAYVGDMEQVSIKNIISIKFKMKEDNIISNDSSMLNSFIPQQYEIMALIMLGFGITAVAISAVIREIFLYRSKQAVVRMEDLIDSDGNARELKEKNTTSTFRVFNKPRVTSPTDKEQEARIGHSALTRRGESTTQMF
mmetsp:Transcript_8813/g.8885  ORF Transcript_8813/g.8885 Transcript_8813/m.8885 type:complete len:198 (+) Transcript_8813:2-595(+)